MASAGASEVPKPVSEKTVASEVAAEVPKPVSEKAVASASHLSSTEGAAPRSSSTGVKGSTDAKGSTGVKASGSSGVKGSGSSGVKASGSTGKAAAADRTRGRYNPIPALYATGDVMEQFPIDESGLQQILQAQAADGGGASTLTLDSPGGAGALPVFRLAPGGPFWVSKEDADMVQLKMEMPGLGKEHVTMKAEKDALVIKGEGDKGQPRYTFRVGLSSQAFKLDQSKAEMKNGVLMVTVPKVE